MAPSPATCTARRTAAVKAGSSLTVWSAEVITSTGSAPLSSAASAASVTAGAVLRPTGSSKAAAGSIFSSRNWSSTRKRCSSLPTMVGGSTVMPSVARPCSRLTACWNRLKWLSGSPDSTRNCFG